MGKEKLLNLICKIFNVVEGGKEKVQIFKEWGGKNLLSIRDESLHVVTSPEHKDLTNCTNN